LSLKDAYRSERIFWEKKCISKNLIYRNVDEEDEFKKVRIIKAVIDGLEPGSIKLLVLARADVNCRDKGGKTPMYHAVSQFLLNQGPSQEEIDSLGLHINVSGFIVRPMNVIFTQRPMKMLQEHRTRQVNIMETLLELKADVDTSQGEIYESLLMQAVSAGSIDSIRFLMRCGADAKIVCTNSEFEWAPLNCAAEHGYADVIDLRVSFNADLNRHCSFGRPIFMAVSGQHHEAVQTLIKHKANLDMTNGDSGESVLSTAFVSGIKTGRFDIFFDLLKAGADIDDCWYNHGTTLLGHLSSCKNIDAIKMLAANGADVNHPDCDGRTPVYLGASEGHVEVINALVEFKADVNRGNTMLSRSPVYTAAENGHATAICALLENKAAVNAGNMNPLSAAIKFHETQVARAAAAAISKPADLNFLAMIELLLKSGVDVDKSCAERLPAHCWRFIEPGYLEPFPCLAALLGRLQAQHEGASASPTLENEAGASAPDSSGSARKTRAETENSDDGERKRPKR